MDHRRSVNVSHCYCRLSRERVLPHNYVHTHGHTASIVLNSEMSNRNGDLQTFVTSVDERCHHEDGFDIQEGVCVYTTCA